MRARCGKTILNEIRDFFCDNKKFIICFTISMIIGLIIGIVAEINGNNGEFERIYDNDIVYSATKVFFFSALYLAIGYFVIIVCSVYRGCMFLSIIPFFLIGFFLGEYMCRLISIYGSTGVFNLVFVYLPFLLAEFCCLMLCAINAFGNSCGRSQASACNSNRCGHSCSPFILIVAKWYAINIIVNFVVIMCVGSIVKVIVIV